MEAVVTNDYRRNKVHPKKFALYVACASIMMMFAAFTSAYIVRQAAGNWLEFEMPQPFFISTGIIIISSLTLQLSYQAFKKENFSLYKGLLVLSFVLGASFLVFQYQGWQALTAMGVELTGNPSGSFVYVISGVHAAHVIGGIAALTVALIFAFILPERINARRKLRFELTLTYWHFVGVLWIYLLLFFIYQR